MFIVAQCNDSILDQAHRAIAALLKCLLALDVCLSICTLSFSDIIILWVEGIPSSYIWAAWPYEF